MALKIRRNLRGGDDGSQTGRAAQTYVVRETDPMVGTVLDGRYNILARLGEGGMSTVYKAQHRVTGRVAALKILRRGLSMDSASTKRFEREAKAISSLSHPNLITVHDFGTTPGGQPYQVIEYLEGRSLADIIGEGPLAPERAVAIFRQICDAMQHAHSKGIIHRDLKPENIMLITHDGRPDFVKVVDFGIVKLTEESQIASQRLTATGEVWGSPLYASPEQCMGKELD
ncbi:MAG TPA: serine/threonine-protein kinase, partial [Candidatus Obscuribacterales bacterium]